MGIGAATLARKAGAVSCSRGCCPLTRCCNPGGRRVRCFELFPVVLSIAVVWSCGAIATAAGAYNHASPDTQKYCRTDQVAWPRGSSAVSANRNPGNSYMHEKVKCRSIKPHGLASLLLPWTCDCMFGMMVLLPLVLLEQELQKCMVEIP